MEIYRFLKGEKQEYPSLFEAFYLQEKVHQVLSFVGAGGKTSLMFAMAEEAAKKGFRVIVTTSTKIFKPMNYPMALVERAKDVEPCSLRQPILIVGRLFSEEKLISLPEDEIGKLRDYSDILLIEADGARRLPLKLPGEKEPVLIEETDMVIGCAGLDSIGQRFCDACFRFERAEHLYLKKGEDRITPSDVANVLSGMDGAKKGTKNMQYRAVLNKADLVSPELAAKTALEVEQRLGEPCVIASRG